MKGYIVALAIGVIAICLGARQSLGATTWGIEGQTLQKVDGSGIGPVLTGDMTLDYSGGGAASALLELDAGTPFPFAGSLVQSLAATAFSPAQDVFLDPVADTPAGPGISLMLFGFQKSVFDDPEDVLGSWTYGILTLGATTDTPISSALKFIPVTEPNAGILAFFGLFALAFFRRQRRK